MNNLQKLARLRQSVWCDNLSRSMIDSGELTRLIDLGIVGITSNPTIFMKAITTGQAYDERFLKLLEEQRAIHDVYEGLVIPDIIDAADTLRPVFDRTGGVDGYVSLEVNPKLAYRTEATIAEAKRLFARINRPNVFIKVPATEAGIPAIEAVIAEGINVNVTLIFAIAMYKKVMQAYLNGLKRAADAGRDLSRIASVASFFVSRVDTLVDLKLVDLKGKQPAVKVDHLLGNTAIANAQLAFARFLDTFDVKGPFATLAAQGARVQRPLWASTSTKNPHYSPTMYVDNLVGPDTVNTIPPQTIDAVLASPEPKITLGPDTAAARAFLTDLGHLGIDMQAVTDQLTVEGVKQFSDSYDQLIANLEKKQKHLRPVG